jgi:hypothetical protein
MQPRKPFWRSKKFWAVRLGILLRLFGRKLNIPDEAIDGTSTIILAGVGAEAAIDAADAIGRGLKRDS